MKFYILQSHFKIISLNVTLFVWSKVGLLLLAHWILEETETQRKVSTLSQSSWLGIQSRVSDFDSSVLDKT